MIEVDVRSRAAEVNHYKHSSKLSGRWIGLDSRSMKNIVEK